MLVISCSAYKGRSIAPIFPLDMERNAGEAQCQSRIFCTLQVII